ncbi:MAG TPA: RNase HI-like protein [Janthinobacterium sp.]|nr:RNase HI-like protein [Janthinobacterium sp.]
MPEFDALSAAANHGERVRARRLAKSAGIGERQALERILDACAGAAGLASLLADRAAQRLAETRARAAKTQEKATLRAMKQAELQPPATAWLAWFDGSAHPNPGKIGIGALLTGPRGERVEICRRAGHGNSGEAEYAALIALMEAAVALGPAELRVYGDSQVVIDDVKRMAATGAKGLESQRARVAGLIAQLPKVALTWIPRHKNAAADRLSQRAVTLWDSADQDYAADVAPA